LGVSSHTGRLHAGTAFVLRADFSNGLEWVAGGELLAGVPAKSGGSFLHLKVGKPASGRRAAG